MKAVCTLLIFLLSTHLFGQNLQLLAHYPLTNDTKDQTGLVADARLVNSPISEQGVYLGGRYGSFKADDTKGTLLSAYVPNFNPKNFSLAFSFKIEEKLDKKKNIMSLSRSCRYYNVYLNADGKIGLELSNGDFKKFSSKTIEGNTWYQVICTYDDQMGQSTLSVDGELVLKVNHQPDFSICGLTKDWSTTDFGNGNSFRGYLKDWQLFSQAASPEELQRFLMDIEKEDLEEGDDELDPNDEEKEEGDDELLPTGLVQEKIDIKLSHKPFNYVQICARPDGYSYLAWNENVKETINTFGNLHISTLDKNFNRVGEDITLGTYEIRQILALDNDYIYLIVGERKDNKFTEWYKYDYLEANILYFMKIDRSGNTIFKTTLFGDKGQGPKAIWADNGFGTRYETKLAFNGEHFALYTGIRRNFASQAGQSDVHEGDLFMILDKNGNILEDKTQRWYSSHAFYLKLAVNERAEFVTANLGDAYPVGILVRNRKNSTHNNVWPPEKITYQSGKTWYFAAGRIGELLSKGDNTYLIHASSQKGETQRNEPVDVLFLQLNTAFKVQRKKWLTNTSQNNEQYVFAGWLNNNILVAYSAYDNYNISSTKLLLVDTDGEQSLPATPSKVALNYSSSHFVPFPDGSLVITKTDAANHSIQVLKVSGRQP